MEIEKIKLRENPLFEITMTKTLFEIRNDEYSDENGKYEYEFLESIKLHKKQTNLLISIFSTLLELIFLSGLWDSYKSKQRVSFKYKGELKRITLNDCDSGLSEQFVEKLKRKISETNNT